MPVYNGEEYLEEALDGLLGQTYKDFELVISDNASTDRTAEICREYAERDPRIRYVRQAVNVGAVPNHNLLMPWPAVATSSGRGMTTSMSLELLERSVDAIEVHPEAALVSVWDAIVESRDVRTEVRYPLDTANPRPT